MIPENQNNGNNQQPNNPAIIGRTHNSQHPAAEQEDASHDISSVDQQEGNMNNGESGGNFDQEKKED